jgi:hypothetical protein
MFKHQKMESALEHCPEIAFQRYYSKAVLDVKRISKVQSSPVTWHVTKGIPNGFPSFSHDFPMIGIGFFHWKLELSSFSH